MSDPSSFWWQSVGSGKSTVAQLVRMCSLQEKIAVQWVLHNCPSFFITNTSRVYFFLLHQVERFYDPTGGKVTLDGTALTDLNVGWLREQIGLVSQEPRWAYRNTIFFLMPGFQAFLKNLFTCAAVFQPICLQCKVRISSWSCLRPFPRARHSQNFAFFFRENIAYGCPCATMEQIEEAARVANCYDFITSFPKGFETQVGDKGTKMSGGK